MLSFILSYFTHIYLLWIFYLAVMSLSRAKQMGTLSRPALILGYPILAIGYFLDAMVNWFVLTLVLGEFPREVTVTARLKRLVKGEGYQQKVAYWICHNLLDAFDPSGSHCK